MSNMVRYVVTNKQLAGFENCFGVLSRLWHRKGSKTLSHSKCLCGKYNTVTQARSSGPGLDYHEHSLSCGFWEIMMNLMLQP